KLKFLNNTKLKSINKEQLRNYVLVCSNTTRERIKCKYKNHIPIISYGDNFEKIAQNLYLCLRLADSIKSKYIIIEGVKPVGLGKTIMDRIIKASSGKWLK
ncbi:MAG: hypothetical protein N2Z73_02410, partial [Endomicrobia bacterium]|nr:hypothetical protein [Endomicrobiia bacterium]